MLGVLVWLLSAAWAGTIVDARGKTVSVTGPQRIVVLGGGLTETVFALGLGDRVVGVDAGSVYPPAAAARASLGYHRQLGAEGILSLAPDLVLGTADAGPPSTLAQLESAGVPVAILRADPGVEGLQARIEGAAALLDRPDAGTALLSTVRAELSAIPAARSAGGTPPRVMFIYARGGGTLNVSGSETAADAMIRLAGGQNAVAGYTGYKPLTAEGAIQAAPDVLLVTEGGLASLGGRAGLLKQPGISLTPAGQAGRVVVMDDLLLLGFGPRTGAAAQQLHRAIQGE